MYLYIHNHISIYTYLYIDHLERTTRVTIHDVQIAIMRWNDDMTDGQTQIRFPALHLQQQRRRHDRAACFHWKIVECLSSLAVESPNVPTASAQHYVHFPCVCMYVCIYLHPKLCSVSPVFQLRAQMCPPLVHSTISTSPVCVCKYVSSCKVM